MSNPTANFGWVMPTATDLVTDLPADFAVFGQAVDTSLQYLLGGTTGQVLSKTSGTNMAFSWVTPQVGDITAVNAGTGISGGGTTGDVTITNSMATAMTTSGDLIQATGSGTFARLGTGTNGQYLTTNGTTNSWGTVTTGSMTLLSTTTLTGASTTISSISGAYNNLRIVVYGVTNATADGSFTCAVNAASTGIQVTGARGSNDDFGYQVSGTTNTNMQLSNPTNVTRTSANNKWEIQINDYASTAMFKSVQISGYYVGVAGTNLAAKLFMGGAWASTSAVTSLVFANSGGNLSTGTVLVYGVK